jgi:hypothetical protein
VRLALEAAGAPYIDVARGASSGFRVTCTDAAGDPRLPDIDVVVELLDARCPARAPTRCWPS